VRTHIDSDIRRKKSQRIEGLKNRTLQLERRLVDARDCLEREIADFTRADEPSDWEPRAEPYGRPDGMDGYSGAGLDPALDPDRGSSFPFDEYDRPGSQDDYVTGGRGYHGAPVSDERTEVLVNRGRSSAYRRGVPGKVKVAAAVALVIGLAVLLGVLLSGGGGSWPASVAVMQREAAQACRNPDVRSEPGQVNFACAKDTRQILWAFALMTSAGNPKYRDAATNRAGLEPITPSQGGEIAWSLNLHHPYEALDPIDSLAVAARAINNIIGGATVTGSNGHSVVQTGLEGHAANCLRYTGSAATQARQGYPRVCANPIAPGAGEAALVADVYQKWVVGATPKAAQDAAVLFENAHNPGDARVQYILKHLPVGTG
jgi:hypothetical protein